MAILDEAPMCPEMRQEIDTSEQEVCEGMQERFLSQKLKQYYRKEQVLEQQLPLDQKLKKYYKKEQVSEPMPIDTLLTIASVERASTDKESDTSEMAASIGEYNTCQEIPGPKPYEMRDTIMEFMEYVTTCCVFDI
eukprot:CAMPEP_0194317080 /NCGR_PEP_ID=MMETSP0171-20130528/13838_1 /TAXON_ID=218684 /ORGANISM="Corethron pennatum, Strain L29A3" /LENGTH=135 /DNA_ID=CAMNT_0039073553 /DNA_START=122 /DNA_END=526 /DNA_ORIENTATION=-